MMPRALVTSGPTFEPIDPVRFIGNRSSGKQGHAIGAALKEANFEVTLITGPTQLADPEGVTTIHITTAEDMLAACIKALPVDVAVCAAAVSDWRVANPSQQKTKKDGSGKFTLHLEENPDILHTISNHPTQRPKLVVGFAAETQNVLDNATTKRARKGCDWILANQVSGTKGFHMDDNQITLITSQGAEAWPVQSKQAIAQRLAEHISQYLE